MNQCKSYLGWNQASSFSSKASNASGPGSRACTWVFRSINSEHIPKDNNGDDESNSLEQFDSDYIEMMIMAKMTKTTMTKKTNEDSPFERRSFEQLKRADVLPLLNTWYKP